MASRFRPSSWAGRDARLVGTRPRVRGCPRWCWHFCTLPALSRRSGDVGSLPPPRSSEIEATHPHVNCRAGACWKARPLHATGPRPGSDQPVPHLLASALERALGLPLGVALGDGLALVVVALAACEREL